MYLPIAVAILCGAAFADGYTTVKGIKSGRMVESNPLLVKLYGTNTPSALQTYGGGYGIIAGESALAWLLVSHNVGHMNWFWPTALLFQAGWHVVAAILNERLIKKESK
jgi:hypothetical protein